MQDVDLDGDLDLWVLNGHGYPEAAQAGEESGVIDGEIYFLENGELYKP